MIVVHRKNVWFGWAKRPGTNYLYSYDNGQDERLLLHNKVSSLSTCMVHINPTPQTLPTLNVSDLQII